eukprot:3972078-Prymnesium_polylepis.1
MCLLGCGSLSISTTSSRNPSVSIPACSASASAGTTSSFVAAATPEVTTPYTATDTVTVEDTEPDWCSYDGGVTVLTGAGVDVCASCASTSACATSTQSPPPPSPPPPSPSPPLPSPPPPS